MRKVFCILLPYVSAIVVWMMHATNYEYISTIEALVLGLLIGIWFYCVEGSYGTRVMLVLSGITLILSIGIVGVGFYIELFEPYMYEAALWCGLELVGLILLLVHKPKQGMTYSYSYRNSQRRYF